MTMMRTMTTLTLLLTLTACNYDQREEARSERAEQRYQDAIAKYKAEDYDAAEEGFLAAVKENPGNASARFQLAVLLQENRKDYLGAMSCYREFLLLADSSGKAQMARERAEKCELLLAKQLAEKYGFSKADDLKKELAETIASLDEQESAMDSLKAENRNLRNEIDRLKGAAATIAVRPVPPPAAPSVVADKPSGLRGVRPAEDAVRPVMAQANPSEEQAGDARGPSEALALLDDARKGDESAARSSRTKTYVVRQGDGLNKIVREQYGVSSNRRIAEIKGDIRRANPGLDPDKITVGMKIELPNLP